jgi:hypothetical protein
MSEPQENSHLKADSRIYSGMFLISLATLLFEILLTRLFSATMWYHFAFIVLSLAMFGLAVGATIVYRCSRIFSQERTFTHLGFFSLLFAFSTALCQVFYLVVMPDMLKTLPSSIAMWFILVFYLNFAVPFVCSGVCTTLALTRFKLETGKMYAADLLGAALACLLAIVLLFIIDAPSALLFNSALSALAGWCFLSGSTSKLMKKSAVCAVVLLTIVGGANVWAFNQNKPLIGMEKIYPALLFQKWSPMSFVTVRPAGTEIWGWGIDPELSKGMSCPHNFVFMDCHAGTPLYKFNGDFKNLDFLKLDVSNLVHSVRWAGDVFIIGIGGGKDILGAVMHGHKRVTGAEFNNVIIDVDKKYFADYIGHIDKLPGVEMVNDEARSFLARSGRKFEIVQATLIDTFVATAGGGLALTENSLYTSDAWKLFFSHLTDNGVLSFTYAYSKDDPSLAYRLCSMAYDALKDDGVANMRDHIVIVGSPERFKDQAFERSVATILVGKKPFTAAEIDKIEATSARIHYQVIMSPRSCTDDGFLSMLDDNKRTEFVRNYPKDISSPTDDRPFFLCMSKISDYLKKDTWSQIFTGEKSDFINDPFNPLTLLFALLFNVGLLTVLCVMLPLTARVKGKELLQSVPLLLFFSSIGFGFMMIEISQMARLSIFLGHPVFGLSVVLFTLLITSGLGSLTLSNEVRDRGLLRLVLLVAALIFAGFITPLVTQQTAGSAIGIRIVLSILALGLPGFFMGMALPLGMKIANAHSSGVSAWLWGMNGATSVLGSILATILSTAFGIQTTFWVGVCFYVFCTFTYLLMSKRKGSGAHQPA